MALELMYITKQPDVARIAERAGVDRVFVDMEYIGKEKRQHGLDTVQCHHTAEDAARIRKSIKKAKLMVRCNPIHGATANYNSSQEEIEQIIAAGADVIMLPYFKTAAEVSAFVEMVDGRAKVFPLLETPEAAEKIDEILAVEGIDEIHIGMNDLSLGYGKKFMFELLADGTVERLCMKFRKKGIPYGFGGIASIGKGLLPAEMIIKEHYRLGSTRAILSRSFCDAEKIQDLAEIERIFNTGVRAIRQLEEKCQQKAFDYESNRNDVVCAVRKITGESSEEMAI